jgi:hypothetical protein
MTLSGTGKKRSLLLPETRQCAPDFHLLRESAAPPDRFFCVGFGAILRRTTVTFHFLERKK